MDCTAIPVLICPNSISRQLLKLLKASADKVAKNVQSGLNNKIKNARIHVFSKEDFMVLMIGRAAKHYVKAKTAQSQ